MPPPDMMPIYDEFEALPDIPPIDDREIALMN